MYAVYLRRVHALITIFTIRLVQLPAATLVAHPQLWLLFSHGFRSGCPLALSFIHIWNSVELDFDSESPLPMVGLLPHCVP